jgi:hypothetical protein
MILQAMLAAYGQLNTKLNSVWYLPCESDYDSKTLCTPSQGEFRAMTKTVPLEPSHIKFLEHDSFIQFAHGTVGTNVLVDQNINKDP